MVDVKTLQAVAESIGPAVVGLGAGARGGSGVVVGAGRVVTLARNLRADEVEVRFQSGRRERGRVLGSDWDVDLAVVEVETGDVTPATWAEDADLGLGTPVIALGDPGGQGLRATAGALSTAPRGVRGPRGRLVEGALEHTAPLPRGSGGGPLVDLDGRVLGLNAVRQRGGLLLAWPAAALAPRVAALAGGERERPRRLGVAVAPPRMARRLREAVGLPERDGLLVRAVQDGSPAQAAGVARGDLIVAAGGRELATVDDLYAVLDGADVGAPLTLGVVRGADERELTASLAPEDAA